MKPDELLELVFYQKFFLILLQNCFPSFQSEIGEISRTLQNWFEGCDEMLACLQDEAMRANAIKATNFEHKVNVEKKVIISEMVQVNSTPKFSNLSLSSFSFLNFRGHLHLSR